MVLLNGIRSVGDGIIFKGQILECVLPSYCQPDLPYNPRQLPVTQWVAETMVQADQGDFMEAAMYEHSTHAPDDCIPEYCRDEGCPHFGTPHVCI